ncbi:MAG: CHAT domain-containing protein [Bacteroidia bacterium]|nr:CHAT domain-containing protein [Bacteroidia bacterium]
MKRIISIIVFVFYIFSDFLFAQDTDTYNLFLKYSEYYNSGDFIKAEESLLSVLNPKNNPPEEYIVAAYNNLGNVNNHLGKYKEALEYYDLAETHIINEKQYSRELADIYINRAIIYGIQKSYTSAIDYFEKGIRIYQGIENPDKSVFYSISTAYLDIGIIYYEVRDYQTALKFLENSSILKINYHLPEIAFVYLNMAKTFAKTKSLKYAEKYFLKSLEEFKKDFGEEYYRIAEVYFDYGFFLHSLGKNAEALEAHKKALSICRKNYGEKHTLVSSSYKYLGDDYLNQHNYDSALFYYQKSIIAVVKDFNNPDVFANPSIDSVIFDIRLLDDLKSKASALELLAGQQNGREFKLKTTEKSLETIELAMQLIDRIRNNYLSQESRIYLAENEKETYLFATRLAYSLFTLTNNDSAGLKMYDIAKKAKAAVLRNEITGNELFYSVGIPDSLRNRRNRLSGNISAYNNLILEELRNKDPDEKKISLWKDALFDMNRENEKLADRINREFPQYHDLLQKTEPVALGEIQKHISKDETVIDYLLSNQYSEGKRKMYIFLITKDRLEFRETGLDSLFIKNAGIIREWELQTQSAVKSGDSFQNYTAALFYMYDNLIRPVESLFSGNRLIIIPDEEIAWLPFDAFLKNKPSSGQTDYEGLHYLIYDYTFSYGYSSSMIFRKVSELKRGEEVYAFSPDYGNSGLSGNEAGHLRGAGNEIEAIFRLFSGKKFTGDKATESNFREAMQNPAIFHMAMHSLTDSSDSRYSYMLFDPGTDSINDGKLYNYEISISRIQSPMVVLSACNSGTGTLYHGEGLMSLARGFILAGTSSVVKTAWKVNDEASAAIITRFYYHLSKGKPKDVAMHLAKLEYLKGNPPLYANPYYWAAYEVMGDNSPIALNNNKMVLVIITVILILAAGLLTIRYKRRSIFAARSL